MSGPGTSGNGAQRWESLAREAARRRDVAAESADRVRLLTFQLDGAPYALPVERVREIVRMRPITPVPRMPADVCGVISLRGEIVQVVDLRLRLGLDAAESTRRSRIVVVHGGEGDVAGLLVDSVTDVFSAEEAAMRPTGGEIGAVETLCLRGEIFVSVVDLDGVLAVDVEQ